MGAQLGYKFLRHAIKHTGRAVLRDYLFSCSIIDDAQVVIHGWPADRDNADVVSSAARYQPTHNFALEVGVASCAVCAALIQSIRPITTKRFTSPLSNACKNVW